MPVSIPMVPRPPQRSPISPMTQNSVQSPFVPVPRIPQPPGVVPPKKP